RCRAQLRSGVDDDVFVLAAKKAEELFESRRVVAARTIEEIRSSQDLDPGLVLHHELAHELAVQPMHVVQRGEQRVTAAEYEEQRCLAEALLQIDDQRRALSEACDVDAEVDGNRRRTRAA